MGKIEQCKREHSAEFLDNRDDEWKAYAYVKASRASHSAPVLEVGDTRVMDDKEIVDLLLSSFFPKPSSSVNPDGSSAKPKLITRVGSRPGEHAGKKVSLRTKLPKWTLAEDGAVIMQSKSDKAPGLDEITFRV